MHYVAPCFAFNLAEIAGVIAAFYGWQSAVREDGNVKSGFRFMAVISGVISLAFSTAAISLAWSAW